MNFALKKILPMRRQRVAERISVGFLPEASVSPPPFRQDA